MYIVQEENFHYGAFAICSRTSVNYRMESLTQTLENVDVLKNLFKNYVNAVTTLKLLSNIELYRIEIVIFVMCCAKTLHI